MAVWEPGAATAVVGLATFELWNAYEKTAPSLEEARAAEPGDLHIRQRILDADLTVGSLALIIGVTFYVMTKNISVLVVMLIIVAVLSVWRRSILAAESR
jgi:hypothetical protein